MHAFCSKLETVELAFNCVRYWLCKFVTLHETHFLMCVMHVMMAITGQARYYKG